MPLIKMNLFEVVLVLLILTVFVISNEEYNSSITGSELANSSDVNLRIVGGQRVDIEDVPYQAAIIRGPFLCGGAIVHNYFVLTAAHCINKKLPDEVTVIVGSTNFSSDERTHHVYKIYKYVDYLGNSHDIALLQVTVPFQFNKKVGPIALPHPEDPRSKTDDRAVVTGWGSRKFNQWISDVPDLQKINVELVSLERCRKRKMETKKEVTYLNLCTTASDKGTCFGDSGGPLVHDGKLIGIVSWGSPCAMGDPDVFTRVQPYVPWISQILKNFDYAISYRNYMHHLYFRRTFGLW